MFFGFLCNKEKLKPHTDAESDKIDLYPDTINPYQ